MKNKLGWLLLILSYCIAFGINLIPSIKHPDSSIDILNIIVTFTYLVILLLLTLVTSENGSKILKVFSILGVISGVVVFLIKTFESTMIGNGIFDLIVSLQYPLYLIFSTPLFGINVFFDLGYGTFSLILSIFYLGIFILLTTIKTNSKKV